MIDSHRLQDNMTGIKICSGFCICCIFPNKILEALFILLTPAPFKTYSWPPGGWQLNITETDRQTEEWTTVEVVNSRDWIPGWVDD